MYIQYKPLLHIYGCYIYVFCLHLDVNMHYIICIYHFACCKLVVLHHLLLCCSRASTLKCSSPSTWIGLGRLCRWASRGVLAKLGDVEDIVNIFESPPEIQSVSSLPNTLQHPEKSNKPRPKLPSPSQVKCFWREQHFFSHIMLLKSVVLVKVALPVLLGSLEMILGILDNLLNVLCKVNSSRPPTLMPNNCINR